MLSLFFLVDDATCRVFGTHLAQACGMAGKSLADRVAALEAKVGGKSIEAQFREQAELIDRRFDDEFRQQAELIDKLFAYRFEELDKNGVRDSARWSERSVSFGRC